MYLVHAKRINLHKVSVLRYVNWSCKKYNDKNNESPSMNVWTIYSLRYQLRITTNFNLTKTYPVNLNKQSRHMSNMKHDTRNIYNSGHFAHEQWNDYHRISHFVCDTDTNKLKKFLLYLSIFISATSIYYWQIFKRIMLQLIFEWWNK